MNFIGAHEEYKGPIGDHRQRCVARRREVQLVLHESLIAKSVGRYGRANLALVLITEPCVRTDVDYREAINPCNRLQCSREKRLLQVADDHVNPDHRHDAPRTTLEIVIRSEENTSELQ